MILESVRNIPPLILIPLLTVLFGASQAVEVLSVALYSSFTITVYALNALSNLPVCYEQLARLLGATRLRRMLTVLIPGMLPALIGPMRLTFSLSLGIAIVAEYLAAPTGIGRVMKYATVYSDCGLILAGVIWTVMLSLVFDILIVALFSLTVRWTGGNDLLKLIASDRGVELG